MKKMEISAFLPDLPQAFDVAEPDGAALDFDEAPGREFAEHAGHHLAGGIHVAGDFFLGLLDLGAAGAVVHRDEVHGEPLVEPLEQHGLYRPDGLRVALGLLLENECAHVDVGFHQLRANGRGDHQDGGVPVGGDFGVECQLADDARRGRYAHVALAGAVERDFAALVRYQADADRPAQDKDYPEARGTVAGHELALGEALRDRAQRDGRLLVRRKVFPEGEPVEHLADRLVHVDNI